jgi:hypothetical protein
MKPNSALVYNKLQTAQTFRDKFRKGNLIAKVGRKFVIVTLEQANRVPDMKIVDETPTMRHFTSRAKWTSTAKAAGCKVKLTTRWAAGGGYYQAIHPERGIVGFYNDGIMNGRGRLNGGHLHV